jgi:hypothetical protein
LRTRDNLITERSGVNYVRSIVEAAGCLFKEINLQHDFGHDATVVPVVDGEVQPREVALQIKSGRSYNSEGVCHLPATASHIDFWAHHDLTTLGVIYDPEADTAFWIDLQSECRARNRGSTTGGTTISFAKAAWNRVDAEFFPTVLVPALMGRAPTVPIATALIWAGASDWDTHDLGVRTLLARHKKDALTWTCLLDQFRCRAAELLSVEVPLGFAKALGHCDIGDYAGEIAETAREEVRAALLAFDADDIAKLLFILEDHDTFDRGELGYAFLPLLGGRSDSMDLLAELRDDDGRNDEVRAKADFLLRWYRDDPDWWRFWRRDT